MRDRRSVRVFRPEAPPRELIERLIEAAVTAPSAGNRQPWRFLAVIRREAIDGMVTAVREAVEGVVHHVDPGSVSAFQSYSESFTRFAGAPVVIAVLVRSGAILSHLVGADLPRDARLRIAKMERASALASAAAAMQNLLLAAHAHGLGASAMTGPLVASDRLEELLLVPASWELLALVPVGYPAESAPRTDRKPVRSVLKWIE